MADYSIDLETLHTGSYAVVLSVGICKFNLQTGEIIDTLQVHIDMDDMMARGFKVSGNTLRWWMGQNPKAQIASFVHPYASNEATHLVEAVKQISQFISNPTRVWGNGPSFDCQKVADMCEAVGKKTPWPFYKERCLRTLIEMSGFNKDNATFEGTQHNSLHDAIHQAKLAHMAWHKNNAM